MNHKHILLTIIWLVAVTPVACKANDYQTRQIKMAATAYTHSEAKHSKWGRTTASGSPLRFEQPHTSAAADWSFLPLGTEFRIVGLNRQFIIEDYGSGLVGKRTVDLYFPSKKTMNAWGKRQVTMIITKHGDYNRSREILQSRKKYGAKPHVLAMLNQIEQHLTRPNHPSRQPAIPTTTYPKLLAAASIPRSQSAIETQDPEVFFFSNDTPEVMPYASASPVKPRHTEQTAKVKSRISRQTVGASSATTTATSHSKRPYLLRSIRPIAPKY